MMRHIIILALMILTLAISVQGQTFGTIHCWSTSGADSCSMDSITPDRGITVESVSPDIAVAPAPAKSHWYKPKKAWIPILVSIAATSLIYSLVDKDHRKPTPTAPTPHCTDVDKGNDPTDNGPDCKVVF